VELKNGETYNGHVVNVDSWMNIHLREVICTSKVCLGAGGEGGGPARPTAGMGWSRREQQHPGWRTLGSAPQPLAETEAAPLRLTCGGLDGGDRAQPPTPAAPTAAHPSRGHGPPRGARPPGEP
jgi:small nuclear ribonucleoprotein (snRNP)-like protein